MQRNRPRKRHSQTGEGKGRDWSGHGKKQTKRGSLTSWRRQREGLFRTLKESDRARRTHNLEAAEGGTCQDTEGQPPSEAHSLARDRRGRDLSGPERKAIKQGSLTSWRWQREGLVRTWKQSDQARRTHFLERAEGGICQDTEGQRPSETHSQTEDRRGRDLSEHGKKATEQGALTYWRP